MAETPEFFHCVRCNKPVLALAECVKYRKGVNELCVIVRPELAACIVGEKGEKDGKRLLVDPEGKVKKVSCGLDDCGCGLGSKAPFGPKDAPYIGLSAGKLKVGSAQEAPHPKAKWPRRLESEPALAVLEERDDATFWGTPVEGQRPATGAQGAAREEEEEEEGEAIRFPEAQEDFEWQDLIVSKIRPRDYQVGHDPSSLSAPPTPPPLPLPH